MPSFSDKSLSRLGTCDPRLQRVFHEVVRLCLPFISSGVHQERRPVRGTGDGTIFAVRRA